jgi:3-methyladenine DNA glycosylase AlkD
MLEELTARLELLSDPKRAVGMSAYMRDQFEFLGIPAPVRQASVKEVFVRCGAKQKPLETGLVLALWDLPEREYQYTAVLYLHLCQKRLEVQHLALLEQLVCSKSWWDTVDSLAPLVGILVQPNPHLLEVMDAWASHKSFWLRRVAIIFQLRYKRQTDQERLFLYCQQNIHDKEFFIRKAIGWALREYAKVAPNAVLGFVEAHPELSGLSKREALKHL